MPLSVSQFLAALRRRLGEAGGALKRAIAPMISIAIIAAGIATAVYVARRTSEYPYTDDATIDADVVHVAAAVGGRILELPVTENAKVSKGDLLFRLDPVPYRLAVDQAQANLELAMGALDTRRRTIATEKSNAAVAREQVTRAQTNFQLASRTTDRLRPLASRSFVPIQQFDQAETAERDAQTSLRQAQEQEAAALHAIGTEQAAVAAVEASKAALGIARRALDDTVVRAWHDGRVVGLTVLAGEMVIPSQSLFTLISTRGMVRGRQLSGNRSARHFGWELRDRLFHDRQEQANQRGRRGDWMGRAGYRSPQSSPFRALCAAINELGARRAAFPRAHPPRKATRAAREAWGQRSGRDKSWRRLLLNPERDDSIS